MGTCEIRVNYGGERKDEAKRMEMLGARSHLVVSSVEMCECVT
jgi:hypothetical protein